MEEDKLAAAEAICIFLPDQIEQKEWIELVTKVRWNEVEEQLNESTFAKKLLLLIPDRATAAKFSCEGIWHQFFFFFFPAQTLDHPSHRIQVSQLF